MKKYPTWRDQIEEIEVIRDDTMNLIDRAARLKEQQATEASATYQAASDEFRYECDMLNAAPALLEVLGGFQPGDAGTLSRIIQEWDCNDECGDYDGKICPECVQTLDILRRLQAMAAKMEAER